MRLIDADDLIKLLQRQIRVASDDYELERNFGISTAIQVVSKSSTVDAVEVVRCKDCKCYKHEEEDEVGMGWCSNFKPASNERFICWDNWYCGDGQRKDG